MQVKFINLSGTFHSYYLSSGSVAILPHPSGYGPFAFDAILQGNGIKGHLSLLQLPHHVPLEGFTIPNLSPSPMLYWNLLLGRGGTVGQALVAHAGVDLISFTGGLATGEAIMAAAARGVRRVALELGGKNPNIVFDGTDFDTVVDNALTAAFLHSGQVCSAGARLIVH